MKKSNLYTKGGDKGETSLVSGTRVSKGALQIDLYGEVDELNSHIGYLISLCHGKSFISYDLQKFFESLQSSLFDLGSNLACEAELWEKYKLPKVSKELILEMESLIDKLDGTLPELKSFILPGGSVEASYAHIVRTTCRKVERLLIGYKDAGNEIPELSIELLNRLSDFMFVFSRYINAEMKQPEVLWKPRS